ncbi:MAG: sodium:proton antiporter [Bacteroidia bacterium]
MKHILFSILIVAGLGMPIQWAFAQDDQHPPQTEQVVPDTQEHAQNEHDEADHHDAAAAAHDVHAVKDHDDSGHKSPSPWMVLPFIVLLLMIATGPVFFEHFWHKNYKFIAPGLGLVTLIYYLFFLGDTGHPAHALAEYVSFIALLGPLYVASGGILIQIDKEGKPMTNLILLLLGSVFANVIGTTGASMLLIRPFIRLNRDRLKPYHIVFFIFMVSNVGGALTPIGDPPLFLGFLRGVPFFWTVGHVVFEWVFALALLSGAFLFYDYRNKSDLDHVETQYSGKFVMRGTKNFFWLAIIVGAVFLDPNKMDWLPAIEYHGTKFSFVRELIQLGAGAASYFLASKQALKGNEFTFEPIMEVVYLFAGIFFAMMPALALIGEFAGAAENAPLITEHSLYWATGTLSSFLDNAPTYVNFLSAACAKYHLDVGIPAQVGAFAEGHPTYLAAISVAAVFFGAMTYIGNGPNFMVKAIAEERGVEMPSFFGYMIKYSIIILLPILALTWLVFFFR